MSTITNVIVTFHLVNERETFEAAMVSYFAQTDKPKERLICCNTNLDFPSYTLESNVYVGAFNYFDEEAFLVWLFGLPWYDPSTVQVFLCRQDEDTFTCILPTSIEGR